MTPENTTPRAEARKENEARPGDEPPPDADQENDKPDPDHRFRDWALI